MHAIPLFEAIDYIEIGNPTVNQHVTAITMNCVEDAGYVYELASDLLFAQRENENSYKSFRSEITCFLHWCFDVVRQSPGQISRRDMDKFVAYCQSPPQDLIGQFNVAQFKLDKASQQRVPNPLWRPFVGKRGEKYHLSDNALKTKMAILSSFYGFLVAEDYCERNPAQAWMNHSKFAHKRKFAMSEEEGSGLAFTELQWSYVISTVERLAKVDPEQHQRSLFLIKLIYGCYLRVSDVSARAGYSPIMGQFKQDKQTGIWRFHIPKSKGGKQRQIPLSNALLTALKQYRKFLGLAPLPSYQEQTPIFVRHRAAGRGREAGLIDANLGIRQVRESVQSLINQAADVAEEDGLLEDAEVMRKLTVHSIRHTGITHDINLNGRPLSHVQADAGHESIDTTSQYLHTSQAERHQSAANKPLDRLAGIE
ncbi:tyrosine-type recombinase/integrase [Shewanella aquimarina]|uniref:tyrosine-type recombinase/integrase n=1 Tax=Shewanella aquimarina TaxID=260365 RepID=UPI002014FB23|nr:site-specific integrase [Shewanella aquimarina]MCL2909426.1 site-specific integrase [Shewanella aquimarina]